MLEQVPDGVVATLLAVCCVVSVGLCAATMESTVTTDPAEVIDVPSDLFPFGNGAMDNLRERVSQPASGGDTAEVTEQDPEGADDRQDQPPDSQQDADRPNEPVDESASDEPRPGPEERTENNGSADESLLERLLGLLPWLLALALLAVSAAYYRDRITALLGRLRGDESADPTEQTPSVTPTPSNEVARAWNEMLTTLGIERCPTKTPDEYAQDAVRAGIDRDIVGTLTTTFQEVRYGGAPVTDERVRRAQHALARLRHQSGGGRP